MAYGKIFSKIKQSAFLDHSYVTAYNKAYKKGLALLKPGDKVILCNRWDIQYDNYISDRKLKNNNKIYMQYIHDVIKDLDEQIIIHPELNFYIIGVAINPNKRKINGSFVKLNNSILSKFLKTADDETSSDMNKIQNTITNKELTMYAASRDNVKFIDRNEPINNGNAKYKMIDNGHPLFSDSKHYTNIGGIVVGQYLMEQVLKDQN